MYEQFKNQFMLSLSAIYSKEDVEVIASKLDIVAYDYEVTRKETALVPYNEELPEMVKTFLVCKKIEGIAEQTLYNYGLALKKFFRFMQKSPEQIKPNDIRVYLYDYQKQHKISNRSLDKIRQVLSSFYTWANCEGYMVFNPILPVKPIKYEEKPRQSLTQIDLEYLRQACKTVKEKAIIEFLYSTGCRVSEMARVKKSDIDWDKKSVHLLGKGNKHRYSYMNAKAEVALKNYFESRTDNGDYVFVSDRKPHSPLHDSGLQKIIRILAERAADNVTKKVTPHVFRHTTATTALNNGMPIENISKLLGHANIATTMIYAKATNENIMTEHKKCII